MFKTAVLSEHLPFTSDESDGFRASRIRTYGFFFYSEFNTFERLFNAVAIFKPVVLLVENYRVCYQRDKLVVLDVLFYDVIVDLCDACLPFDESSVSILAD